jgi:hypothetical protein
MSGTTSVQIQMSCRGVRGQVRDCWSFGPSKHHLSKEKKNMLVSKLTVLNNRLEADSLLAVYGW